MSHSTDAITHRRRSLKANYIAFSVVIAAVLTLGSAITGLYVASVTQNNARALQLRDTITKSVNHIRRANRQADTALSAMVVSPQKQHPQKITRALINASEELKKLLRLPLSDTVKLKDIINSIHSDTLELQEKTNKLI